MDALIELVVLIVLIAAIALGIFMALRQWKKRKRGLTIADTPAVVIEIRKIAELVTSCFFEEKILVEKKANKLVDNAIGNFIASKAKMEAGLISDELCLIAKGQVRAGYDLKKIASEDLMVKEKVLYIKLPEVEILDVIVNPKGWDFYVEDGTWSDEEVSAIKKKAKDAIEQDALQYGILQKASQSGEKKLRALLMSLGFNDVIFNN